MAAALAVMVVQGIAIGRQHKEMARLRTVYQQTREALAAPPERDPRQLALERAGRDLATVYGRLFHVTELAGQMRDLSGFIRQSGLSIDRLSYGAARVDALPLWRYEATFRVRGGYAPLKRLLARIQSSPHLFCIERLAFSGGATAGEKIVMTLTLSTYLRGNEAPLPERGDG